MTIKSFVDSLPVNIPRINKVKRCLEKGYSEAEIKAFFYLNTKTYNDYILRIKNQDLKY